MFENLRIILVEPSHPGNIGASARALKNMGLTRLYLVNPAQYPDPRAIERATRADDILDAAVVTKTLDEALAGCGVILGASTRARAIPWPLFSARECGEHIARIDKNTEIALLFGREQHGLSNEELQRCHYHVHIPANPDYSSLNLAAAVQVICYELRMACLSEPRPSTHEPYATDQEIQDFYTALEAHLIEIKFLDPSVPRQLMIRLKRLFHRAHLEKTEVNILRGILRNRHSHLLKEK